jgi:cytochrome P450
MATGRSIADLPGPRRLPVIGNAHQLRPASLHLIAEEWCRRYGPVFRFDVGRRAWVAVGDPDAINVILRDRPDTFRRTRELASILDGMAMTGVFTAEGDDWRRQRRLAVTALNANHLHRYYDVIRLATERLYARLHAAARAGAPVAIEHDFTSFTVDVTSALAFGHDLNTLERSESRLQNNIETLFGMIPRRLSAPLPYWRYVRLPADRRVDQALAELRVDVAGFIDAARRRMQERPELHEHPENFLEAMLAAQAADERYSEEELFGNTLTMLLAGEDTTAHTLAWTTWWLAREPRIQEQLAAEAHELLGAELLPPDHESASGFGYGEAVLRESMRLTPVASVIFLEALRDVTIADVSVPARTPVLLLTRHAAVQAQSFQRPAVFDPGRWTDHDSGAHASKGFLPFGAGPRFCPGRNLAFLEAKAALAMLARNFEISLDPAAPPVKEKFTFTTVPKGLSVRLRERNGDRGGG